MSEAKSTVFESDARAMAVSFLNREGLLDDTKAVSFAILAVQEELAKVREELHGISSRLPEERPFNGRLR